MRTLAVSCFDKITERLENIGSDYETLEREWERNRDWDLVKEICCSSRSF